ncbi:MAG: hypothetical protein GY835_09075 [bacterium]|nr:hypothetical protein [bacterium]
MPEKKRVVLLPILCLLIPALWFAVACTSNTPPEPTESLTAAEDGEHDSGTAKLETSDGSAQVMQLYIDNQITKSSAPTCTYATSTVTIFNPDKKDLPDGKSGPYSLDLGNPAGLGIQVNFWYWSQQPDLPVGKDIGKPGNNNPDNSGAQVHINESCCITGWGPAWYGIGIETYRIASITAAEQNGECVLTLAPNSYTGCVTPGCCDFDGSRKCQDVKPRKTECGRLPPPAGAPPPC